ncbi:hypothetical protein COO59_19535 [Mixta theicola]|uniref:DUF1176 domain-containing protein n=1 Tax=Mixta theicola TaxID=1458355 RepID=A0A2K1Q4X2_9GAMM|nr:DUF1176 domain-containing protein [Mixta theicola]PNS10051.1 hypothetical protein COO59_19535 [Mixta theicola]GLR09021.1 hypothetical protein GCM10007905_17410 [Mixta theicola]
MNLSGKALLLSVLFGWQTVAMAAAEPSGEPVQRFFKGWQVTCNNLNDCDIRNVDENMRIVIRHQAGPTGTATLDIMSFDASKAEGVWLDEKRWDHAITLSDADANNDYASAHSDSLSDIQALVATAKNATTVSLTSDNEITGSLSGLNAALLFVDERQGRLGNQTALFKTGSGLAASVPPRATVAPSLPPVPPVVPLDNAQALLKKVIASQQPVLEQEECEPAEEDIARSEAQPLDAQHALVMINCGMGAYQSSSLLFITPRAAPEKAQQLVLPLPLHNDEDKPDSISWFTEASYDPQSGQLFQAARGRGIADCGESATWRYDGSMFHLMSYNSQPGCDGGEPGDWPSVWATPGYTDNENSR